MGSIGLRLLNRRMLGVVAIAAGAIGFAGCGGFEETELKVKTATGWVEGQYKEGVEGAAREFLGIPYAKPPVGDLRFAPPQPVEKWKETLQAFAHGPSCMQNPGALSAAGDLSEDCLTLNVYSPAAAEEGDLPVMVFIHGGAFVAGGSNQYDGWRLAEQYGAVVVTLNYRLGALGFLSLPELDAALPAADSGNMGLEDQRLAMQWVQDNIKAFGGDKNNVTLFGESAGSMSTCVHFVAPGSRHLANKFIMQSGVCVGGLPIASKQQANSVGSTLAAEFCADEVDTLACLRAAPAAELVAWGADGGISGAGWGPTQVAGSSMLPDLPIKLINSGQYNQGPVIVGSNANEWGLFQLVGAGESVTKIEEFNAFVDASYPVPLAAAVKQVYAPESDENANAKLVDLLTDQLFRCPSRTLVRSVTAMGSQAWLYSFEEGPAFHAMELAYVFGNPSAALTPVLNEPTRETIQSYWSTFAATSNPNLDGQPEWPEYEVSADQHMILKETSEAGSGLASGTCDFWDQIAAAQAAM